MDFLDKINRQKLQRITIYIIAALSLLALVLLLIIIIASVEGGSELPDGRPDKDVVDKVDDMKFTDLTVTAEQLSRGSLLLVNAEHPYTAPADLSVTNFATYRNEKTPGVPYSVGDIYHYYFESNAIAEAHTMLVALKDETGNDCIMVSGSYGKEDYSKDLHTGYTMVLTVTGGTAAYLSDESNAVLRDWLLENAHEYGFVVRYPADKAEVTGVSDYDYAFRYVGTPHAAYMKANNLCLEEYIALLKDKHDSQKDPLSVTVSNHTYAVYYQECLAGDSIKVPEETPNPDGSVDRAVISGTNEGGAIVTFEVK